MYRQATGLALRLTVRRAAAFWLRTAFSPWLTMRWMRFLAAFTDRHVQAPPHDDLLRKSLATFLVHRMSRHRRLKLLMQHFEIAGEILCPNALQTLWQGGHVDIGTVSGRDADYRLELCLSDHCGSRHEGAYSLRLKRCDDGMSLCTASFIFVRCPGNSYSIVIGGMQGPASSEAKRAMIAATRCLGGLRPKDAALLVLKGLMARSATPYLIAVSNARHAINQRAARRRRMMLADLDAYWIERGGVHFPQFGFRLPVDPIIGDGGGSRRDISKIAFWKAGVKLLRR
ncbi:virK protein [Paramesorhizobium deserti]|uniref:VirK protein n=1 Tax=Paramesorhizobium deserti TaxID=1494590 RepID=A0A135HVB1_9HYPH|nr:virK protein [Paramesorhizobium deserti]